MTLGRLTIEWDSDFWWDFLPWRGATHRWYWLKLIVTWRARAK
jgi:hypothetical protein